MNNLKKLGLTALGTALVASSASAADYSISATSQITLLGGDNGDDGNGWSMSDSVTFSASGEMDNGMSVSYYYEIDNGATGAKAVGLTTDMGTLTFAGMDNSGPISAWDDITPNANEESWGTATGATATAMSNASGSGNVFIYDYTIMDGLALKASYAPSAGSTRVESSLEYGFLYTGMDGLKLYAAMGENNNASNKFDNSMFGAVYTMDGFSVGYQINETDGGTANTLGVESDLDMNTYDINTIDRLLFNTGGSDAIGSSDYGIGAEALGGSAVGMTLINTWRDSHRERRLRSSPSC